MTGASLRYLIKEGFRNTWTNRMMSIASICVLMSCLVLIGSASMIFLNMDSLLSRIEEENVIMVYIKDDANQAAIDTMGQEIKALGNVKELEYVPKEKAWAQQLETMEDAQAKFFTQISSDIPLPNAYKVTVADLGKFDQTVKGLKGLQNVDTIRENKDLAQKLVSIRQGITVISVVIIGVLFAISLFIISNTIKLTVYSRRLEISIMKSVGATNSFVRLPFVVEGMILGIVSGAVSLGLVWGLYELAVRQFGDLLRSLSLSALPFAAQALHEIKSGAIRPAVFRTGRKNWIIGKVAGCVISGMLLQGAAVGLLFLILNGLTVAMIRQGFPWGEGGDFWPILLRRMLCGGIWAGVGCVIALATETASAAYLAPLCLCYALMMIGTRFFPDAMMLNPMQWVSGATWFLTIVLAFTLALQALFLKRGAQKYV